MFKPTIGDAPTIPGNSMGTMLANRYRVVRPLGHGGMGSVWLAEDVKLDNRPFAIKMLPSILVDNRRAYEQVKREALIALKLVHPNIVQIRALEEASEGGNPFLVMDFIDGQTLDDYLAAQSGGISEADVVRILTPVAAALDYAHAKGVVHRDVKPGNVMIAKDGTPIVLDFGIAREIQETMTRVTGKLSSGTLTYMSPEQLHGAVPKPAQDVYSFAAMAYECLTGTPPFARGQIEYQIDHDAPAPLPDGIGIAPGIMAGLAKKPENRPATCAAVLGRSGVPPLHEAPAGNAPVADSESAEKEPVPRKSTNWFVGLLVLLIAVIAGVVFWGRGSNVKNGRSKPSSKTVMKDYTADAEAKKEANPKTKAPQPPVVPVAITSVVVTTPPIPIMPPMAESAEVVRLREELRRKEEEFKAVKDNEKEKREAAIEAHRRRLYPEYYAKKDARKVVPADESARTELNRQREPIPGEDPELADLLKSLRTVKPTVNLPATPAQPIRPPSTPTAKPQVQPPAAKPLPSFQPVQKPFVRPAVQLPVQKPAQPTQKTETLAIGGATDGNSIPWLIELPVQ